MRLRNQLVVVAENFAPEKNLPLIPRLPKNMDEQLKLAHNVVYVVHRANRKICVTLLQNRVNKPESFYAQIRILFKEEEG